MDFSNSNFNSVLISWNISIRKAWNLSYMTHRYLVPALAGRNLQDMIISKFLSMYQCMSCSTNEYVKFISKIATIDARSLINNNLKTIASQWHINIQDLIDGVPVPKPNLADKLDDVQKHIILCILDIDATRNGIIEIPGININELKHILDSVSTN